MGQVTHMPGELMAEKSVLDQWPCLSLEGLRAARAAGIISWVRGKRGTAWYRPDAVDQYIRAHHLRPEIPCEPDLLRLPNDGAAAKPANRAGVGQIYFIHCPALKAIKIGIGQDVKKRLSGLQTGSAEKLILLGWLWGTLQDERAMHARFHDLRLSGEWFRDCERLRAFITEKVAHA